MSSSSNLNLSKQYWYGSREFRDASDYTLFKKRQGISQLVSEPVRPALVQSLQNRSSYQFSILNCRIGGCTSGGFPRSARLS